MEEDSVANYCVELYIKPYNYNIFIVIFDT